MKRTRRPVVCSIGSTDPLAAAGLFSDLRVYARLGATGAAVLAGITAQNNRAVSALLPVSPKLIDLQLRAVWQQKKPSAVCIGLLPDTASVHAVRKFLSDHGSCPFTVLDPVLYASSGQRLTRTNTLPALRQLCSLVDIITPNQVEAAQLAETTIATVGEARATAAALQRRYGCAVLITGGDTRASHCIDVLADDQGISCYRGTRIAKVMRGTGGILSAALAVNLALNFPLRTAIMRARRFARAALRAARRVGTGATIFD